MKPKFKVGDYIQHKNENKRKLLKLKGKIINICKSNNGTKFYQICGYGFWALLMENQNDYETTI